jgi:hypothetical protein
MNRLVPAAASLILLVAACAPSSESDPAARVRASIADPSPAIVKVKAAKPGGAELPSDITIPSSVGEVVFRHEMHIKDFNIGCVECHHQINARKLDTPHPDYLKASWVSCATCHSESPQRNAVYACSECHRTNPVNIADETASAKVVIHQKCWKCHEVARGEDASKGCEKCHSGRKSL